VIDDRNTRRSAHTRRGSRPFTRLALLEGSETTKPRWLKATYDTHADERAPSTDATTDERPTSRGISTFKRRTVIFAGRQFDQSVLRARAAIAFDSAPMLCKKKSQSNRTAKRFYMLLRGTRGNSELIRVTASTDLQLKKITFDSL